MCFLKTVDIAVNNARVYRQPSQGGGGSPPPTQPRPCERSVPLAWSWCHVDIKLVRQLVVNWQWMKHWWVVMMLFVIIYYLHGLY